MEREQKTVKMKQKKWMKNERIYTYIRQKNLAVEWYKMKMCSGFNVYILLTF